MRLVKSYDLIKNLDYDWIDFSKSYFYSFTYDKLIQYDAHSRTNIYMALKSKYARLFKSSNINSGVDFFLISTVREINANMKYFTSDDLLSDGIETDEYNTISKYRNNYYIDIKYPFIDTDNKIEDIGLPEYIVNKIKTMNNYN